jgi:mannonate dehydratase
MSDGDVYEALEAYSRQGKICYVHFRSVRGKVPCYQEVFVDESDIDMVRVVRVLHHNGYGGVIVPDHTPEMSCAASWVRLSVPRDFSWLTARRAARQDRSRRG